MAIVPESVRSRAWAAAKPVAQEQRRKQKLLRDDESAILIVVSRALDAALAEVYEGPVETEADKARRRLVEEFGYPNRTWLTGSLTDEEATALLSGEERIREEKSQ